MSETHPDCAICNFAPDPAMVLTENEDWTANLRDNEQTLLGTTIIAAKQHIPELHLQTAAEELSFIAIRNQLFRAVTKAFDPQTFNITCLKNHAFTSPSTLSDAGHVHWHVKPRYAGPVEFSNTIFRDPMPGHYLENYERLFLSHEIALKIAAAIRSNFN